jgi:hypothetical protein
MNSVDWSIFDINTDAMEVSTDKIDGQTIVIIDNFYKNPDKIVEYMYSKPLYNDPHSYYTGKRRHLYFNTNHITDLIGIIKPYYKDKEFAPHAATEGKMMLSKFVDSYLKKRPMYSSSPHFDIDRTGLPLSVVAGLCYLSKDIHGGTGFYKSKYFNTCKLTSEMYQAGSTNLNEKIHPYKDVRYINDSCEYFELIKLIEMKWNRFILYEGNLLHGMYIKDGEFYKTHDRIASQYWMDVINN